MNVTPDDVLAELDEMKEVAVLDPVLVKCAFGVGKCLMSWPSTASSMSSTRASCPLPGRRSSRPWSTRRKRTSLSPTARRSAIWRPCATSCIAGGFALRHAAAERGRLLRGRLRGLHRPPEASGDASPLDADDESSGAPLRRGAATAQDHPERLRREAGAQAHVRRARACGGALARLALH